MAVDLSTLTVEERALAALRSTPDRLGHLLDPTRCVRYRHTKLLGLQFRRLLNGTSPFQIWTLQPQIGKSTIASHYGPVWAFETRPDLRIILDSYAVKLSRKNGGAVRDTIRQHRDKLTVRLNPRATAAGDWSTTDGGRLLAVGVDGQVTGNPGDLIVIDDPHKGWRDAQSSVKRDTVWEHYRGDLLGRLQPNGAILVIMTRWHPDDLVGRILADGGLPYEVTHIPAIADHRLTPDGDPLGRADGEVVDPRRFPKSSMLQRRRAAGPYIWGASYQGDPRPPAGNILRAGWIRFRTSAPRRNDVLRWITSWDLSFSDGPDSSFVVGQLWALTNDDPHRFVLWDQVREQADYVRTRDLFREFTRRHPYARHHLIESKANGPALIADMRSLGVEGIIGLDPSWAPGGTDETRKRGERRTATASQRKINAATLVSPLFADGRVELPGWLPESTPWIVEFLRELGEFPNGDHDDQVDAATQAIHWLDILAEREFGRQATVIDERLFGRR